MGRLEGRAGSTGAATPREAVLEAPKSVRPGLFEKLEELTATKDQAIALLAAAQDRQDNAGRWSDKEIELALEARRELGPALLEAGDEEAKELLAAMVSRIEVHFDHELTHRARPIRSFAGPMSACGRTSSYRSRPATTTLPTCSTMVRFSIIAGNTH